MLENQPHNPEAKSITELLKDGKNAIRELFLKERETDFQLFEQEQLTRQQVPARFQLLTERLRDANAWYDGVASAVDACKRAEFPKSILTGAKNGNGGGPVALEKVAGHFTGAFLVKTFAKEIEAGALAELTEAENILETFTKENAAILKSLKLV